MANKELPASEEVNIHEFINQWQSIGMPDDATDQIMPQQFEDYVQNIMGQGSDVIAELSEVCSVEALSTEGAHCSIDEVPADVNLITLQHQQSELERRRTVTNYQCAWKRKLKYQFSDEPVVHAVIQQMAMSGNAKIAMPDSVINVRVYFPYSNEQKLPLRVSQEFQVLGSQPLSALRDKIHCSSDQIGAYERSSGPVNLQTNLRTKDVYTSSFFFIENTFYNDLRNARHDCSDIVLQWIARSSTMNQNYQKEDMSTTKFSDLQNIKMGYPYLYLHQGNCEHLVTFSDISLLGQKDCTNPEQYPLIVGTQRTKRARCRACITGSALWIVRGSQLTPEDPCFLCDTCYRALHYDEDGNKLIDFKAYVINQGT